MNYKNVKIDKTAKIARQTVIIGDVTIGRDSCVLYYSVIRGDDAPIVIGEETNIQENCVLHESDGQPSLLVNTPHLVMAALSTPAKLVTIPLSA